MQISELYLCIKNPPFCILGATLSKVHACKEKLNIKLNNQYDYETLDVINKRAEIQE